MPVVMSTDINPVKVQVFGKYFEFKPGQLKVMEDTFAHFLCTDRADRGFVSLPDEVMEDPNSEASKAAKEDATRRGRERIMGRLEAMKQNLEVSLQKDLDTANMKLSSHVLASKGEIEALKHLAALQGEMRKAQDTTADEVKKLLEKTNGDANNANAKPTFTRG